MGISIDKPVITNNAERILRIVLGFNQASKSCLNFGTALDFAKTKAVSSSVNCVAPLAIDRLP
jgi:hypothetical protein